MHELAMVCGNDELPRSYLIKQCRDDLNKMCHITWIPESAQGIQLAFNTELETVLQNMVSLMVHYSMKFLPFDIEMTSQLLDINSSHGVRMLCMLTRGLSIKLECIINILLLNH